MHICALNLSRYTVPLLHGNNRLLPVGRLCSPDDVLYYHCLVLSIIDKVYCVFPLTNSCDCFLAPPVSVINFSVGDSFRVCRCRCLCLVSAHRRCRSWVLRRCRCRNFRRYRSLVLQHRTFSSTDGVGHPCFQRCRMLLHQLPTLYAKIICQLIILMKKKVILKIFPVSY